MPERQFDRPQDERPAPPTQPGEIETTESRSTWPTTLGIVAVVFGSFGVLGGVWGALSILLFSTMPFPNPALHTSQTVVTQQPNSRTPVTSVTTSQSSPVAFTPPWGVWTSIWSAIGAAVAGLLLAVGVGLLRCRRWAVTWGKAWACVKIVFGLVGIIVWSATSQAQFASLTASNPNMPATALQVGAAFGMCFQTVFVLALPGFLLMWLSRAKIKAEVSGWR